MEDAGYNCGLADRNSAGKRKDADAKDTKSIYQPSRRTGVSPVYWQIVFR